MEEDVAAIVRFHLLHALEVLEGNGNDLLDVRLAPLCRAVVVVLKQLFGAGRRREARAVDACCYRIGMKNLKKRGQAEGIWRASRTRSEDGILGLADLAFLLNGLGALFRGVVVEVLVASHCSWG